MSLVDPLACGFAKVVLYEVFSDDHKLKCLDNEPIKNFKGRILKLQYNNNNQHFKNCENQFSVEYKKFTDKFPLILENIRELRKKNSKEKENRAFMYDCKGCFKILSGQTSCKVMYIYG